MIAGKRLPALLLSLLLSATVLLPIVAPAQKLIYQRQYSEYGKTQVSLSSPFSRGPTHGFLPVRVTLKNDTDIDREWRIHFDSSNMLNTSSTFRIEVKAGGEITQDIVVPVPWSMKRYGGYRQENIRIQSPGLPTQTHYNSEQIQKNWPNVTISKRLATRNLSLLNNHLENEQKKKTSSSHRHSPKSEFAATFASNELPSDWRAYIGYDAMMIAASEWYQLRPGVKKAILGWIRFGGMLQIYTESADRNMDFRDLGFDRKPTLGNIIRSQYSYGSVELHGWNGQDIKLAQTYNTLRNAARRRINYEDTYLKNWGIKKAFGTKSFSPLLVMLILTIFSVVVGPVNLFSFAKAGQRHRLFVTTPVISLIASALVIAIILFKDGIGGDGRRILIMNLESAANEKRAYLTQEQISRTGVLLGNHFRIQDSTFITQAQLPESQWSRKFDYSNRAKFTYNGELLGGEWFQSRTEQAQVIHSVSPTRSRIELTEVATGDQAPRLFSSLEFTVEELFYVGDGGRVWKAKTRPIAPGSEVELEPSSRGDLSKWWIAHTDTLSAGYEKSVGDYSLRRRTRDVTRNSGHFYATSLDPKVGFVETLDSVKWVNADALIFGPVITRSLNSPSAGKAESQD